MAIRFKDIEGQEVIVEGPYTLLIPGPLTTSSDGKCRVIFTGAISMVPLEEALRLRDELFPKVN